MKTTQIRICGFGGQGVILAGMIMGKAAAIFENIQAALTQSFGPEARGGACSASVIISESDILYPYVTHPDVLIAMSQEAFNKFIPELAGERTLIYEEDLVKPEGLTQGIKSYGIPATRIAEEIGRRLVANIVIVGAFTSLIGIIQKEAMLKALLSLVPKGTEDMNEKAFERGYQFAEKLVNSE